MAEEKYRTETMGGQATLVEESGISLLRKGELVLPAAGAKAQGRRVSEDARTYISYHFPVEIEVRGSPEPLDPRDIADQALRRLVEGLEGL